MRRFGFALTILMCISFALVPFNTLHAHISADHDYTQLHGGHTHDSVTSEPAHAMGEDDHVVQAHFALADGGTTFNWVHWLPLVIGLGFLLLFLPRIVSVPRPPGPGDRPFKRRSHWRPLLRGPPLTSI